MCIRDSINVKQRKKNLGKPLDAVDWNAGKIREMRLTGTLGSRVQDSHAENTRTAFKWHTQRRPNEDHRRHTVPGSSG